MNQQAISEGQRRPTSCMTGRPITPPPVRVWVGDGVDDSTAGISPAGGGSNPSLHRLHIRVSRVTYSDAFH